MLLEPSQRHLRLLRPPPLRATGLRPTVASLAHGGDPRADRAALLRTGQVLPLLQHQLRAAGRDRAQGHGQVRREEHPRALPRAARPDRHLLPGPGAHRQGAGQGLLGARPAATPASRMARLRPNTSGATWPMRRARWSRRRATSPTGRMRSLAARCSTRVAEADDHLPPDSGYGLGMRWPISTAIGPRPRWLAARASSRSCTACPRTISTWSSSLTSGRTNIQALADRLTRVTLKSLEPTDPTGS